MSRVYFHTQSAPAAELRGSERAYASGLVNNITLGLLEPDQFDRRDKLHAWLPPGHYLNKEHVHFAKLWETAFVVNGEPLIIKDGVTINAWELALNTAFMVGCDAMRFLARLHAQCEIHAYVEGPHREWLARIITDGRSSGLYRSDQGWEGVIDALRASDDEPVVLSYSVCEQFPNSHTSDWMPQWPDGVPREWKALTPEQQSEREARSEAWYELPRAEQWDRSLRAIRENTWLEMKPDQWADYRFGHNMTALDLFKS